MTTQFIQRLELIRQQGYGYREENLLMNSMLAPNHTARNIRTCYYSTSYSSYCLPPDHRNALRGSLFHPPALSSAAQEIAQIIVRQGEKGIKYWSLENFRHFMQIEIWGTHSFLTLSRREQTYLRNLAQFYMRQMRPTLTQILRHPPHEQAQTQARYSNTIPTQSIPNPATCRNPENWIQHELRIPGLEFAIPVFIERSEEIHWVEYEENLQEAFFLLKKLLPPEVINAVLNSHSLSTGFSIAIGSGNENSFIEDCSLGGNGGFAHPTRHQLILRSHGGTLYPATNQMAEGLPGFYAARGGASLFFHEFSHLVDFVFLNHEVRSNLTALRNWMHTHYNRQNWQHYRDPYLPNCHQNPDNSPHCLDFSYEIFAALFETYAMYSLFGPHLYQRGGDDPEVIQHRYAQMTLMRNLFQSDGIHLEALSLENIAQAYQVVGIPLSVEELRGHERTLWSANIDFHPALQVPFPRRENSILAGLGFTLRVRGTRAHAPNWLFGFNQNGFYPWGGNTTLQLGISTPDNPEWHADLHLNGGAGYGAPYGGVYPLVGVGASLQYLFTSPQRYVDFGLSLDADWFWNPTETRGHSLQLSAGFLISPRVLSF